MGHTPKLVSPTFNHTGGACCKGWVLRPGLIGGGKAEIDQIGCSNQGGQHVIWPILFDLVTN